MATTHSRHLMNALKIVLVGDAKVGKTWLLSRAHELYATLCDGYSLLKKPFDPALVYSPTAFETCFTNVDTADLGNYQTNIWDTGGCAIFNFVRPVAYIRADVFMVCFDLSNRESFNNVTDRWLPELHKYQPKTPVLIVGTKSDLRGESESSGSSDLVSACEAQTAAERMGCLYQETSAQTSELVAAAFETAVKLGHTKRKDEDKQSQRSQILNNGFDPTWIPPMRSPPDIKIAPSTYVNDFKKVLEDTTNADFLFEFEDGSQSIPAHKIVLWLTPSAFKDVLQDKSIGNCEQFKDLFEVTEYSDDFKPSLNDSTGQETCPKIRTVIVLKNWISRETFVKILEFLYTGEAGISKDNFMERNKIKALLTASEKLKVQSLVDICNYLLKRMEPKKDGDDEQKSQSSNQAEKKLPRLSTPPPRNVQTLFLEKEATLFSDVTFLVDGTLVYAHKAILVGRSSVFAALLSERFRDGKSSEVHLHGIDCQSFLALLEYLYTDHCMSLERIPVENVLILADQFCLARLVQICERHMHKDLQQILTEACLPDSKEIMDALAFSRMFNATQLTNWYLHFIALNFTSYQGTGKELDLIVKENKKFFEEHRWPPQDYLQALEQYKLGAKGITAVTRRLRLKRHSCLPRIKCVVM